MLKRIITSIVALAVFIPVLLLSKTWVFPCAMAVIIAMCLFEMIKCVGFDKQFALTLPLYLSAAFPILQRYSDEKLFWAIVFIFVIAYVVYAFAITVWSHGKLTYNNVSALCFISAYIVTAISSIVYIRDFGDNGKFIYLLIFLGAWMTDIFAYFTGVFFGKHKLIEDVSPKKTIEGSIGGIFFCAVSYVVFGLIVNAFFGTRANLIFLAISGALISVVAQIGDLIMSVIKRQYGIKDYGKIFPGHGGMLDRFDSILAVSLGMAVMCVFSNITGIHLM